MATYCMSDIHGNYDKYMKMLQRIDLKDRDSLYILGDVVDRGKEPLKILQDMMMRINVFPIIGNHEYMALSCLKFLIKPVTEESIKNIDKEIMQGLMEWQDVGGDSTIKEFQQLDAEDKEAVIEYLEEFTLYEEVSVKGKDYVLVHAGLEGFSPDKALDDYHLSDMVFKCPDYSKVYFKDKLLVTGHMPTAYIKENPLPNRIYKANNHIAIDCGCAMGMEDGSLGAICLETGEEFYV